MSHVSRRFQTPRHNIHWLHTENLYTAGIDLYDQNVLQLVMALHEIVHKPSARCNNMSGVSKTITLIFLRNSGVRVEPVKTFVIDGDDFKEANKAHDVGYNGGDQWRRTCHTDEVLKEISAALYVTTLARHVAFTEMLQQHKEDFTLFLQHMAYCYNALLTDESNCARASIAIIHLFTQ